MSKDKAEEKTDIGTLISERAREYRVRQYNERIVRAKSYFDSIDVELAFKSGATIFSTENAQLREALREIVKHTDEMMNARTDLEYNLSSVNRTNAIEQAKQLLTDNTKEDETDKV